MCLNVFLGVHSPITIQGASFAPLGMAPANRTPPPLQQFPFVYYIGQDDGDGDLGCSCLLAQHVEWRQNGPIVHADPLADNSDQCPFNALRSLVTIALQSNQPVALACDDSDDMAQKCDAEDYDHSIIHPDMITPNCYLFADPVAVFPWRVFFLTNTSQ
ncbi:MAG: hypothetical protein ACPGGK_16470 [Pikeienuella sp.]